VYLCAVLLDNPELRTDFCCSVLGIEHGSRVAKYNITTINQMLPPEAPFQSMAIALNLYISCQARGFQKLPISQQQKVSISGSVTIERQFSGLAVA
jgi:hypothetical protein